jgi:tetratricopeptide (TPR) repeat protein
MRLLSTLLLIGLVLGSTGRVMAAGGGGEPTPSAAAAREDPQYVEGVNAVKRDDYPAAIRLFEAVVAKDDRNANVYNWLAYSTRKNGDAAKAIPIYEKALAIDPKHRGAHEYIGEAYLVLGDLPKAKEHLAILDKLCFLPCEEYSDLKKAVRDYERSAGRVTPASKTN